MCMWAHSHSCFTTCGQFYLPEVAPSPVNPPTWAFIKLFTFTLFQYNFKYVVKESHEHDVFRERRPNGRLGHHGSWCHTTSQQQRLHKLMPILKMLGQLSNIYSLHWPCSASVLMPGEGGRGKKFHSERKPPKSFTIIFFRCFAGNVTQKCTKIFLYGWERLYLV